MSTPYTLHKAPPSAGGGICGGCAIRPTCPSAGEDYTRCPVTGGSPPPAPPAVEPLPAPVEATGRDWTDVANAGLESAISAVSGVGLLDVAVRLMERNNPVDADGNDVDWGRLQLVRNAACAGIALVPVDGASAAVRVADLITAYGPAAVLYPVGQVGIVALAVVIGSAVPYVGWIFGAAKAVGVATAKGVWALCRSRLGWVITRPLIWSGVLGVLIITARPIIRILTGA